jgi:hypothetical protein
MAGAEVTAAAPVAVLAPLMILLVTHVLPLTRGAAHSLTINTFSTEQGLRGGGRVPVGRNCATWGPYMCNGVPTFYSEETGCDLRLGMPECLEDIVMTGAQVGQNGR